MDQLTIAQVLGSYGEFFGAIAVGVSLLYIARQSKASNDVARTNAFREMMYGLNDHFNVMFAVGNVDLVVKGFTNYKGLRAEERMRFDHLMTNLFQYIEDAWNSRKAGLATEELMENWSWYPGARDWWVIYKPAYQPELQQWGDAILQSADESADPYSIK
jgi:hypothetical protein